VSNPESSDLKAKAIQLLSRREHSAQELAEKISTTENRPLADAVVAELVEADYVSDSRYADMLVRNRIRQGHGKKRIRQALRQKGITDVLVAEAFEQHDTDWFECAVMARNKRFGLERVDDIKLRNKQIRFLQYRGFDFEQINHALRIFSMDDAGSGVE